MKTWLWFVLLLCVFGPALAQETAQIAAPSFVETECADDARRAGFVCGYVAVPENHAAPDGPLIRLAVMVLRSDSPEATPLLFLNGGPGGVTLPYPPQPIWQLQGRARDVIFFDQRGIGLSEPSLDCPEYDTFRLESISQALGEYDIQAELESLSACHERLRAEGIQLEFYNSSQSAHDVNAIRLALGYDKLNLYGISYGTFLAQYIMRLHPEAVNAVVLDSVLPLDINPTEISPTRYEAAFARLFAACADDPACNDSHPDLEARFYALVNQLNAEPLLIENVRLANGSWVDVRFDGYSLIWYFFDSLYRVDIIPWLPRRISQLEAGNPRGIVSEIRLDHFLYFSDGMSLSVRCHDFADSHDPARFGEQLASVQHAEIRSFHTAFFPNIAEECGRWHGVFEASENNEPLTSDIPTLILSGGFDPITPPAYAQRVAASLPNSRIYEFPVDGHGLVGNACASLLTLFFLRDPLAEPDAACVADEPPAPAWK